MPAQLEPQLELDRCPHCRIDNPNLSQVWNTQTTNHRGKEPRFWGVYLCKRCGGLILATSDGDRGFIKSFYPAAQQIDDDIPERARAYLHQALNSIHSRWCRDIGCECS
jgi:hypothetical protein